MILGRVDEVDGHFIATRFLAVLVPTECLYIAPKKTRTTNTGIGDGVVRIQPDGRSIALAYARVWLPVLAIVVPVANLVATGRIGIFSVLTAIVCGVGTGFAYRAGKLPEREKARLRLLGSVTGLRIDPAKLQPNLRAVKRDQLGELMEKGGIPMTSETILSVIEEIPMPAMPLVYGYARYAGDDPAWRECAELVYQRYEQGEF